ncbi:YitT family protein [uncultured Megasphaera sp.]|uniref:YitT family protein n=1 Tax=uncultured Megasphaera sp. TaxID=165188 RepID=UPI00261DCC68|nr:YitT family protein [uncultured Megasphaera sp.]
MIEYVLRAIGLAFGALVYNCGLHVFLVPNNVIDGGVVGIALMAAHVTGISFSVFIVALNIPFFVIGYRKIGLRFTFFSLYSVFCLSLWSSFLHLSPMTDDPFLSTIFGGIIMGLGVGLIIRWGGSLDGTEIMAIITEKISPFSVGEIVMFFNLFILGSAIFVFGVDSALYSLVAYFIAYKMIDIVVNGLDEMKGLFIVSAKHDEVARVITQDMGRAVTLLHGEGAYTRKQTLILYCVVSRLEITKMQDVVKRIDPRAFITIFDIRETQGGLLKGKKNHE